jgi:hypothetical protein
MIRRRRDVPPPVPMLKPPPPRSTDDGAPNPAPPLTPPNPADGGIIGGGAPNPPVKPGVCPVAAVAPPKPNVVADADTGAVEPKANGAAVPAAGAGVLLKPPPPKPTEGMAFVCPPKANPPEDPKPVGAGALPILLLSPWILQKW